MTDSALGGQRDASLALLDRLIRRGRELQRSTQSPQSQVFSADSASSALHLDRQYTTAEVRIWQQDCAAAINELSGGSKAHWLSRGYSSALLVRSSDGGALVEASVHDIVSRILEVLQQAAGSLAALDADAMAGAAAQPPPRKFEFVRNQQLRPVLEQAFAQSTGALEAGDFDLALKTSCGVLEAIITDALRVRLKADTTEGNQDDVASLAFADRIAAAEQAKLIRGGCARLTPAAVAYRDTPAPAIVSERDARVAAQVLRVVMRDLDPGR